MRLIFLAIASLSSSYSAFISECVGSVCFIKSRVNCTLSLETLMIGGKHISQKYLLLVLLNANPGSFKNKLNYLLQSVHDLRIFRTYCLCIFKSTHSVRLAGHSRLQTLGCRSLGPRGYAPVCCGGCPQISCRASAVTSHSSRNPQGTLLLDCLLLLSLWFSTSLSLNLWISPLSF